MAQTTTDRKPALHITLVSTKGHPYAILRTNLWVPGVRATKQVYLATLGRKAELPVTINRDEAEDIANAASERLRREADRLGVDVDTNISTEDLEAVNRLEIVNDPDSSTRDGDHGDQGK